MGYSYGYGGICCSGCAKEGSKAGVRKRPCPYKVVDYQKDGRPYAALPYCPAPALCSDCYKRHGGLRGLHGEDCKTGAAQMQATADAKRDAIADGEMFVDAAWGQWHDTVPQGKVGVLYAGKEGRVYLLIPAERYEYRPEGGYQFGNRPVLSEIADVMEDWPGHPDSGSKRIA